MQRLSLLVILAVAHRSSSFPLTTTSGCLCQRPTSTEDTVHPCLSLQSTNDNDDVWFSDFDDFVGDTVEDAEEDSYAISKLLQTAVSPTDLTACQTRQFSLGQDLILSDYIGNMGFQEITDWEYFLYNEDDPDERKVVKPNPFDSSQPTRTKSNSGSVVRLFRGEFVGTLGGSLSAQGKDRRVLVKEYSGKLALELVKAELKAIGKLQSALLANSRNGDDAKNGEWIQLAASRSVNQREDNSNVASLVELLAKANFVGVLGEVNLAELEDDLEPNEFYRALGVPPPKPGSVWVVYEYAGLSSVQAYAQPAAVRVASLPPKRGFFGNVVAPPPLPSFQERANYVVKGIMKQAIEAVAILHENGLVHRSIGRSSIILSSSAMNKRVASNPYTTLTSQLLVKLSDFGFAGLYSESTQNDEFRARARTFKLSFREGENSVTTSNFAIAEDMHGEYNSSTLRRREAPGDSFDSQSDTLLFPCSTWFCLFGIAFDVSGRSPNTGVSDARDG